LLKPWETNIAATEVPTVGASGGAGAITEDAEALKNGPRRANEEMQNREVIASAIP